MGRSFLTAIALIFIFTTSRATPASPDTILPAAANTFTDPHSVLTAAPPNNALTAGQTVPASNDTVRSTMAQALHFLDSTSIPESSAFWPHVKGYLFIANLRNNIQFPLSMYQGSNTNFCGYAALSYLPLHYDPLQYARFMVALYRDGKADWHNLHFNPSAAVRQASGTLRFKGVLDIRPGDQMWFLVLADHFRSYLNFFHRRFHAGSEDTFWAACNLGKFNRMVRMLMDYNIKAVGSDLIRPHFRNLYEYLSHALQNGTTFLYVNNTYLHKKKHDRSRFSFPTHFLVLTEIHKTDDLFTIVYWDYGGRTLREETPAFLNKIIFGVTYITSATNGH